MGRNYRRAFHHVHSMTRRVIDDADPALMGEDDRGAYASLLIDCASETLLCMRRGCVRPTGCPETKYMAWGTLRRESGSAYAGQFCSHRSHKRPVYEPYADAPGPLHVTSPDKPLRLLHGGRGERSSPPLRSLQLPSTNSKVSRPVDNNPKSENTKAPDREMAQTLARIEREPIPQRLLELAFKLQKALRDANKTK